MNQPIVIYISLIINFLTLKVGDEKRADKLALVHQVYAQLLQTIGSPTNAPVLNILAKDKTGIQADVVYKPGNPGRIEMGEAVLDICLTFGPDSDAALACLLGHELAHFQYRHGGKQGFFSPLIMPNNGPYSSTNLEALADKSGVFIAYLAGYDALTVAPAVYSKLYDTFMLDNQLPGYPTRAQRLKIVADTTERVQELAQLFEIGEISHLLRDYEAASHAFTALVARYPTAITLNNLGVIKLNQALIRMKSAREDPRLGYMFPIEFDTDNRLLATPRRDEKVPYQALLNDARLLFQTARTDQPANQTAKLNEAITCYLLGQPEQARQLLTTQQLLTPNAGLMMAIVQADLQQTQQARNGFHQAITQGAFRAVDNTQLFEALQKPSWVTYLTRLMARKQAVQPPIKPALNLPDLRLSTLAWKSLPLFGKARVSHTDSVTVYELPIEINKQTRLLRVMKSHRLSLQGLPMGSAWSRLESYAPPVANIAGSRGNIFYEYRQGTRSLFLEYRQNRLVGWVYVTG